MGYPAVTLDARGSPGSQYGNPLPEHPPDPHGGFDDSYRGGLQVEFPHTGSVLFRFTSSQGGPVPSGPSLVTLPSVLRASGD